MSNQLFEITVNKPNGRESHWHMATDSQTVAELLADSIEAQRGFAISIRPADHRSVMSMIRANTDIADLCGNQPQLMIDLAHYTMRACLPAWATQKPFTMFHLVLTERKGELKYANAHGTSLN